MYVILNVLEEKFNAHKKNQYIQPHAETANPEMAAFIHNTKAGLLFIQ